MGNAIGASLKPRIFCASANSYMLGASSRGRKVNFCKFTFKRT
jgi:benzoyl-CoA-dihydrodiol lyase